MLFRKKTGAVSWIVVFLGNPGTRYERTRHNVGFMTSDVVAGNLGIKINKLKFRALTATAEIGGQKTLLMKPQTYMNLSGDAVRQAMDFYKTPLSNVLVVFDDISLPVGKIRVRQRGSSGGHNGIKDIIAKCGGEEFPRIKIGVGAPPPEWSELIDWVLSKPDPDDEKTIKEATKQAAEMIQELIKN